MENKIVLRLAAALLSVALAVGILAFMHSQSAKLCRDLGGTLDYQLRSSSFCWDKDGRNLFKAR